MSKLDKLIAELCPNGVEYKRLKDVATITRGGSFQKKDYEESGFPCIHYGQIYTLYGLFVEETASFIGDMVAAKQKKAVTNDIIMAVTSENIEDVCKCVAWLGDGEVAVSGHTAIIHHTLDPKYLVYYLHSSMFYSQKVKLAHGTKVIEVKPDSLGEIRLPVPPLEVQREIVRMLDNFTFLTAELTAELTVRQKQFDYYRNILLTFHSSSNAKMKTLKDICIKISSGGTPNTSISSYYDGDIPWLRTQEVDFNEINETAMYITEEGLNNSSAKWIPKHSVIVAMYGATVGKVAFTSIPVTTNQACCNLEINSNVANYKYVFYWLSKEYEYIKSLGQGSQTNINAQIVKNLKIAIPELSEQERIVECLDKFNGICRSLTSGIPAEIAARQKQYEYYRDKLLTFKELNA
ncbi:restriction endonuclease subunit S [uncultured Succiniclasticum sp.]|uniref:restriction endonuclease subunit S n=1 Tax=uncultured Succiniclasticum sp. TaxID=1500547 RepID=UPI0025F014D6|nr:restriction endonuclease subunit S [uncultured Succiniclasticum sp.]